MTLKPYEILEKADDYSEYKFISSGPNGDIVKLVLFDELPVDNVYNLALVDVLGNIVSDTSYSKQ